MQTVQNYSAFVMKHISNSYFFLYLFMQTDVSGLLAYSLKVCMSLMQNKKFRNEVLRVLVKLYMNLEKPDFINVCQVNVKYSTNSDCNYYDYATSHSFFGNIDKYFLTVHVFDFLQCSYNVIRIRPSLVSQNIKYDDFFVSQSQTD